MPALRDRPELHYRARLRERRLRRDARALRRGHARADHDDAGSPDAAADRSTVRRLHQKRKRDRPGLRWGRLRPLQTVQRWRKKPRRDGGRLRWRHVPALCDRPKLFDVLGLPERIVPRPALPVRRAHANAFGATDAAAYGVADATPQCRAHDAALARAHGLGRAVDCAHARAVARANRVADRVPERRAERGAVAAALGDADAAADARPHASKVHRWAHQRPRDGGRLRRRRVPPLRIRDELQRRPRLREPNVLDAGAALRGPGAAANRRPDGAADSEPAGRAHACADRRAHAAGVLRRRARSAGS